MNISARLSVNIFFFVNGLIYATWASRIPDLQSVYGMDNSKMGFVLLAHSIGAFIAMPFTGWMIQRIGSKYVSLFSAILFILFFALIGLAPDYPTLLVLFTLVGSSTGVMDVAMNSQAVIVERAYHKPIMTFFHAVFSIGMVVGGLVGSYFIGEKHPIDLHFNLIASVTILMILFFFRAMLAEPVEESDEESKSFIIPTPAIIGLGIIALCSMIGEGAMSDWSTNYMKNILAAPPAITTFGLTAFAGAMTVGRLFGDRGRERIGDLKILSYGAVMAIIGMILIMTTIHVSTVIIGFGLVGLGLSNIVPIAFSLAGNLKNIPPGVGIAMVSTIGYTGFMFGPPIIGFIADSFDLRISFGLLVALFLLMIILITRLKRT